ncbi:MAG: ADP-ribosylation factor-like protein [Candidatus Hermodarchaeota archaeon]
MEIPGEDNPEVRKVVFVGLDNAGKTSIILSLLREFSKFAVIKPTKNAERRTFEFLGMDISEWDLGGHERYRMFYLEKARLIFQKTDILIYVLDIRDYDRIVESYSYLKDIIKKLTEMELEPPIHVFFHKNDPDISESLQIKIKDMISYFKGKCGEFQNYNKFSFHETTIFDLASIITAMSEILVSLFPRSKVIENAISEYANKCNVEGAELIDDNSLIIGSFYQCDDVRARLNSISPYFLRLNDGFNELENIENQDENHIIVERFGKYFIFKQFRLVEGATPYYILICTNEPFLNKYEFNALVAVLQDIISIEV